MAEEQVQEEIMDVAQEVLRVAAPIQHTHDNATTSKNGYMSATDKKKLDGIAENADKSNIIVDTTLNDDTQSTNPVQAKVIMAKIKSIKDTIIQIVDSVDSTSTDKAVNGKAVANYVSTKIADAKKGTLLSPKNTNENISLDSITNNGVYIVKNESASIVCGTKTINIYGSYLTVKSDSNVQIQNIIDSNGIEYSRWKGTGSTSSWSNWKVYYMPRRQYTDAVTINPDAVSTNTDVYNFEIMEDTQGYTIKWNQSLSTNKKYFITSPTAGEWKYVALFIKPIQIEGCFIFTNVADMCDIMITGGHTDGYTNHIYEAGMYIRALDGSKMINGINYNFFVPRNN